jgi:hypothetical protein
MQQQNTVQPYNTVSMRVCLNNLFYSLEDLFYLSIRLK